MRKSVLRNDFVLALLSGVLVGTSYPPFYAWASFFALTPLWLVWWKTRDYRKILKTGFVAQFTLTLIGFNWVYHTASEFGHLPPLVSLFVLLAFCSFASLHFVIAGICANWLKKKFNYSAPIYFASLAVFTASLEWFYPMIFPWNMGYSLLYSHFKAAQLAEIFGFNLLSLFVLAGSACFSMALTHFPKAKWSRPVLVFLAALFLSEVAGHYLYKRRPVPDSELKILLIQPNIGNFDKFYAERGAGYQEPVVRRLFQQTSEALVKLPEKPDLIIWPETAFPAELDLVFATHTYPFQLSNFLKYYQIGLYTGAYSADAPGPKQFSYNGVFVFDKEGKLTNSYRKSILLAFGEYFPGAKYFPFLLDLVPAISNFGRGTGAKVLDYQGVKLAPLICYEGLYTQFVGLTVGLGAQALINITNDSWFGRNFEPYQHMIMTLARAIEFRRPIVRLTNTGITVAANDKGEILLQGPQNQEWAGTHTLRFESNPKQTVYFFIAPYLSYVFIGLVLIVIVLGMKRRELL